MFRLENKLSWVLSQVHGRSDNIYPKLGKYVGTEDPTCLFLSDYSPLE